MFWLKTQVERYLSGGLNARLFSQATVVATMSCTKASNGTLTSSGSFIELQSCGPLRSEDFEETQLAKDNRTRFDEVKFNYHKLTAQDFLEFSTCQLSYTMVFQTFSKCQ